MKKESKIYLYKDRDDYVKKLTSDDVINIIGTKGSGKTYTSLKYTKDDNYIVINTDRLLSLPMDSIEDDYTKEIRDILIKKYGSIKEGEEFYKQYLDIIDYINKMKKKPIIEGNLLYDIKPITHLLGTVIVKRTGIHKCYIRSIKRDYPNKYFLNEEIKKHGKVLGRIHRFKNISKRRKNIYKLYHDIESIIEELDNYKV